eukprot:2253382-Alexandrium_andersonii.AAC.1
MSWRLRQLLLLVQFQVDQHVKELGQQRRNALGATPQVPMVPAVAQEFPGVPVPISGDEDEELPR